ncbi:CDV-1R protein [Salpingoeca rosetta]|uniref:Intraflagellar transport protein 81 homolog n=1 Tax=Salpingoeca rosetta (strain ATCC 50818 / BSB-021) TaxID=946362 RepID=F2UEF9_SALR5|nr:CDV-1R protein [Salpingoeca rosetta]EGD75009.1 CDV-1R protein [Salpingoeca rosetta]|eukprot:XP_004992653.1 CDV-1R protein [Salpingoeca rosetta]
MSDIVRGIVEKLNAPPFNKNFTLIGFDAMSPEQLIETLNSIFVAIAPDHDVDTRQELPDDRVVRMMSLLRVLKYKPSVSKSDMAAGLIDAKPEVIHPIMHWALSKLPELKKRAYLANFLMTIEVPDEMMQNDEVAETREQYLALIDTFKEVHKEVENMRSSGFSVSEVKNDIKHMEKEKDQLEKRVARMQQKYENVAEYNSMLDAARALRREVEREGELERLRQDQTEQLSHAEDKYQRTMQLLREVRANAVSGGADAVIKRTEDEVKMKRYLAHEKLPAAIEEKEKACKEARRILDEPAMTQDDLNSLHTQLAKLEKEYDEKRKLQESRGPRMLKADEFKRYVAKLRTKSTTYKQKKNKLTALQSEHLVLDRTIEILTQQEHHARAQLSALEAERGVSGVTAAQTELEDVSANKGELDARKGETLDDISRMVDELNEKISAKRTSLAPLIKQLRSLRAEEKTVKEKYDEKKAEYDASSAQLESSKSKLETEVKALREEVSVEESRYHYLHNMIAHISKQLEVAQREMRLYLGQEEGSSLRDVMTKKIQEQDRIGKQLRAQQTEVKESFDANIRQLDMWKDLELLMKCKTECVGVATGAAADDNDAVALEEQDRLVFS